MRVMGVILALCLLMTGCGAAPVFEEVGDVFEEGGIPEPQRVSLLLPESAAAQAVIGDSGTLYLCDGFDVTQQILKSGNLDGTLREITGYSEERLSVITTDTLGGKRYNCAWVSAGETGDTVGRAVILDDGCYHYCLTVMAPAEKAGRLQDTWNEILSSYAFS